MELITHMPLSTMKLDAHIIGDGKQHRNNGLPAITYSADGSLKGKNGLLMVTITMTNGILM
jgi:hypothetical protein